jgi:hypothetical protein
MAARLCLRRERTAKQKPAGAPRLRLLITTAGAEQYRGPDPELRKQDEWRMIDNAAELAARLAAVDPARLEVRSAAFADEDHVSVSLASLGRALNYALKP